MAEALSQEPDVNVEEQEGSRGEFTVLVDGRVVSQKGGQQEMLPEVKDVVDAVRKAPAPAGARS